MRVRAKLSLASILVTAVASPGSAQFSPTAELSLHAGTTMSGTQTLLGSPLSLVFFLPEHARTGEYEGVPPEFSVTTRYTESLQLSFEEWAALRLTVNGSGWLEARGQRGSAETRASLLGGVAPRDDVEGAIEWRGFTLLGGLTLADFGRGRLALSAGRRWDWMDIQRDTSLQSRALNESTRESFPLGLPYATTELRTSQWVFGTELTVDAWGPLSLRLGGGYRAGQPDLAGLHREHADDLLRSAQTGPWQVDRINYDRHEYDTFAASLGLTWTFGRKTFVDPGEAAVVALTRAPENAPPTAPGRLPAEVDSLLEAGDSAAALARLEREAEVRKDDPAVLGMLGILLIERASSAEGDFGDRVRGGELLERALRLDPGNPRYLLAYGKMLQKRGVEIDARRVVTRAIAAAAERPEDLSRAELAEAFYQRGYSLETHVAEFDDLRSMGVHSPPVNTPECMGSGAFCLNFTRPYAFYQAFEPLPRLGHMVDDEREAMVSEYRRALELSPSHAWANRRLIGYYARAGAWEDALAQARHYHAATPEDPWASIFLGMTLVWSGEGGDAEAYFNDGLAYLPEHDRGVFTNLRPLIPREREIVWDTLAAESRSRVADVYWDRNDPLYLTGWSEREQEHYARVALAELLYGEGQTGHRGWESDRGQILVRYGRPKEVWQIARDDKLLAQSEEERGVNAGGRWIFWNYDPRSPSFIFEKKLSFTGVGHMDRSMSYFYQEDLKGVRPTAFDPPYVDAGPIASQIVRFRDRTPGRWEVAIFGQLPDSGLAVSGRDTVHRGLFLIHAPTNQRVAADSIRGPFGAGRADLRTVGLTPGIYRYSIEAASSDFRSASVDRGELVVGRYTPTGLRLSDLLLAGRVQTRDESPASWRDLDVEPLRCLRIPDNRVVAAVFELYGLEAEEGFANYRVSVETTEAPATSAVVRLLRGIRNLVDRPGEGGLSWERVVEVQGDRVVEWFELQLPPDHPDEVRVRVEVTDLSREEPVSTSIERVLRADTCAAGNPTVEPSR